MNIVKIQRFSTHDGPGIRTVVFLKGCPLRCKWCHNPETRLANNQILYQKTRCIGCQGCASVCESQAHFFDVSGKHIFNVARCTDCLRCVSVCATNALECVGKQMHIEEIIELVKRDCVFYGKTGGLTVSGGEPMFQPEATVNLLRKAKENKITTAIETCGFFAEKYIESLADVTGTFLWDFKVGVSKTHKIFTGVGNETIIRNLLLTDTFGKDIILRCIMVKGVNMDIENLSAIAEIASKLKHCNGVELIPYHAYGGTKAEQLGGNDNGNADWIPTVDDITSVGDYLKMNGVHIINV